jgi:hypothetical protein
LRAAGALLLRKDDKMTEQPKNDNDVTPKGAVEVDDTDLDQAAGGMSSGGDYNETVATGSPDTQLGEKSAPADPSIGLLKGDPQKKI